MKMLTRLWPFHRPDTESQEDLMGKPQDADIPPSGKDMAALAAMLRGATPGTTIQMHDVFAGSRITPTEHEWYYGTKCRWCQRTAAALHDPNEGQTKLSFSGSGKIRFHCHHCNGLLEATPAQILWFEFDG